MKFNRLHIIFGIVLFSVILLLTQSIYADYTVSGTLKYEDLEQHRNQGFTGNIQDRPVRYVDVAVMSGSSTLAQGATDENGFFSISVSASTPQDISVIAITNTVNTPTINLKVVTYVNGSGVGIPHAYQLYSENNHDPNTNVNVGEVVAAYHNGGDQFNLFDIGVDASTYLVDIMGEPAPPGNPSSLIIEFTFNPNGTNFAFYNGVSVNMDGAYGYDDTIELHEIGHWVQDRFGDFSDNPGGPHVFGDSQQDPRLSFGEGWPTYWGSNVRVHYNVVTGGNAAYNHPTVYMNSNGSITGGQEFSYDLESGSPGSGAASENAVQAAMWDITDGPETPDFTPGIDDDQDNGYYMNRDVQETWDFITTYLAQPPFSGYLTYEDWFDLWVANVPSPQTQELIDMQRFEHSIEYFADEYEPNNSQAAATVITPEQLGTAFHNTTYPEGDEDWLKFTVVGEATYTVRTFTMLDGADTYMRLFNAAGQELASNDNASAIGNPPGALEALRSQIAWTAPVSGDYYVQITRSIFNTNEGGGLVSKYGNWNFDVNISAVPPTFASIKVAPGVVIANLTPNNSVEKNLMITNEGTVQDLLFDAYEYDVQGDSITDFSWLDIFPDQGVVSANQTDTLTLGFNANGIETDTVINQRVRIESNDLLKPVRNVIVILKVTAPLGIDDEIDGQQFPSEFVLRQNYPNPFNPATVITYQLPRSSRIRLTVYNALGQEVAVLAEGTAAAGVHQVEFNAVNLVSGVYFYHLTAEQGFSEVKKMLLLK
jgi:hypothetical protein